MHSLPEMLHRNIILFTADIPIDGSRSLAPCTHGKDDRCRTGDSIPSGKDSGA